MKLIAVRGAVVSTNPRAVWCTREMARTSGSVQRREDVQASEQQEGLRVPTKTRLPARSASIARSDPSASDGCFHLVRHARGPGCDSEQQQT